MTVQLDREWQKRLAQLPETGMGYQLVDILLRGGRWLSKLYVHNGRECETTERFDPKDVVEVRLHDS